MPCKHWLLPGSRAHLVIVVVQRPLQQHKHTWVQLRHLQRSHSNKQAYGAGVQQYVKPVSRKISPVLPKLGCDLSHAAVGHAPPIDNDFNVTVVRHDRSCWRQLHTQGVCKAALKRLRGWQPSSTGPAAAFTLCHHKIAGQACSEPHLCHKAVLTLAPKLASALTAAARTVAFSRMMRL